MMLSKLLAAGKQWAVHAILLLILSTFILLAWFSYRSIDQELTGSALARRSAISYLAAATLSEKFDRLIDIGVALATRVQFRKFIEAGNWAEAIKILGNVPVDFPFIERITLNDSSGTLMADVPKIPEVKGQNFAHRDWHQAVMRDGKPYISQIYLRAASPRINIFVAAIPIKSSTGVVLGILVVQVRSEAFFDWTRNIDAGPGGLIYVVDRRGGLAAHPKFPQQRDLVDFSGVPVVQRVLQGNRGVELAFNPIENERLVVAYEPVAKHGWGIVLEQPVATVFAARDDQLKGVLIAYGAILIFLVFTAYLVSRIVIQRRQADESLRVKAELDQRVEERARAELALRDHAEQLHRLSRTHAMMAECNRVMVHALEEKQLLQQMSSIMVDIGGYRMAWIGFAETDIDKSVVPVACAGIEEGYLATVKITWADSERGRGPSGTAIRTGKPVVARNTSTDSKFTLWREEALKRGYASNLALPLRHETGVIGVLGIYASTSDAFDGDEVALLEKLADDIAYAIGALRAGAARVQAEADLQESQQRLAGILNIAEDAIISIDENHRIILFNQGAENIFGHQSRAMLGQLLDLLLPQRFRESHGRHIAGFAGSLEATRLMATRQEVHGLRKDGTEFPAEASISKFELDGRKIFTVFLRDVTERRRAERALRNYAEQLRQLSRRMFEVEESERRRLARELHDRIGQNVTALSLNLNLVRSELPADTLQKMSTRLNDCESLLYYTAQLVRDIQVDLRPPGLDELGLVAALNEHARQVAGRSSFKVTVVGTEIAPRLPPATEITLFRIVQEALNNITKHAQATEVTITVNASADSVALSIADNGRGFDPAARPAQPTRSLGMVSMRERAESMGGTLRVESAPGAGTRVIVEAPRIAPGAT